MTLSSRDVTSDPEQDPLSLFATEHILLADQAVENDWFSESTPDDDAAWSVATQRDSAVREWRIAAICRRETFTDWALTAASKARQITEDRVYGVLKPNASSLTKFALPFAF